jgi:hypothetical protein
MEFHHPFPTVDTSHPYYIIFMQRLECLRRLAETHHLVHFHANNCCGTMEFEGVEVPRVFECTYVRKDACDVVGRNKIPVPDPKLDNRNVSYHDEIYLSGYPYTI